MKFTFDNFLGSPIKTRKVFNWAACFVHFENGPNAKNG